MDPLQRLPDYAHDRATARHRELLDLVCVGIKRGLNLSDQRLLIGTLGSTAWEQLRPSRFKFLCLPFVWEETDPVPNSGIPQEHAAQLEFKRNQIQRRFGFLDLIRERDPALGDTRQPSIKATALAWGQKRGMLNAVQRLIRVASHPCPGRLPSVGRRHDF
jgi:hypothetical protein